MCRWKKPFDYVWLLEGRIELDLKSNSADFSRLFPPFLPFLNSSLALLLILDAVLNVVPFPVSNILLCVIYESISACLYPPLIVNYTDISIFALLIF